MCLSKIHPTLRKVFLGFVTSGGYLKLMQLDQGLLTGSQSRDWVIAKPPSGANPQWVYTGRDESGVGPIYVALASVSAPPSRETMRALHSAYKGRSTIQLVVGAVWGHQIWIYGPDEKAKVTDPLALDQGCRQLQSALDEPDAIAAYTRLGQFRRSLDTTSLVGIINSGLFASYHIRENVPKRSDWQAACEKSQQILSLRNEQLIKALGFKSEKTAGNALLLTTGTPQSKAVAILLDETEQFDATSARHTGISPVAFGLNVAVRQGVPWLFVLRKDQIRIYPAKDGVGVGQKGQVETYLEIDLAAIDSKRAGLLTLIFSAEALEPNGTAQDLLQGSQLFASRLGSRLRERIYEQVVPELSKSVAEHLRDSGTQLDSEGLNLAYRLTLRILFRLLFQAYAEDRGLLPAGRNEGYDANSLKTIAKRIINIPEEQFGKSKTLWLDLVQVWDAIDEGNETWNVPAYNGGLFGKDPVSHPEGTLIEKLGIQDDVLGPALQHLLLDISEDDILGPVDFRSLSVREFGTIYEGLLESSLSVAPEDLTVDASGIWVPVKKDEQILCKAGEVYFHSASGERRSTGSYFTRAILVDHLIERALEPALDSHLEKIRKLIESNELNEAARIFFDFRVADLAMGSGHFLVAAIDRIESRMRTFLSEKETTLPAIISQLQRLRNAAQTALGSDTAAIGEIEPASLLRRQIARRCIYGLDINEMAVELSRLAIWIHTFVPGLPMSNLNHGLVHANSLTGISSIEQSVSILVGPNTNGQISMYAATIESNLQAAAKLLLEVANSDEAVKSEVKESEKILAAAVEAAAPTKSIFDAALAVQLGILDKRAFIDEDSLIEAAKAKDVSEAINSLKPAHLPYLYPEVFLRENPGFDVILGNPPWKDIVFDEPRFWAKHSPGLMGLNIRERSQAIEALRTKHPMLIFELESQKKTFEDLRKILHSFFPLGSGNTDLYKAFCFKFWSVIRKSGRIGIVLPKTAFSAAGLAEWRKTIMETGSIIDLVTIINSARWAFDIEPRYSVAIAVLGKGIDEDMRFSGAFHSENEFLHGRLNPVIIPKKSLLSFTSYLSIPVVSTQTDVDILSQMRNQPRLDEWGEGTFKLVNELHASNERVFFDHEENATSLEVFAGDSFNIWEFRTGNIFAHADSKIVHKRLSEKFSNQIRLSSSVFFGLDLKEDLDGKFPYQRARIAYRSVSNPTNSRTIIASLIPENKILTHISPYVFTLPGKSREESFLLGVLCSIPFDFYARKFIETAVDIHFMKAFPIPESFDSPAGLQLIQNVFDLIPDGPGYSEWKKSLSILSKSKNAIRDRDELIAENDALSAILFGLSRSQLIYIFDNFQRGWNSEARKNEALSYFDLWDEGVK